MCRAMKGLPSPYHPPTFISAPMIMCGLLKIKCLTQTAQVNI